MNGDDGFRFYMEGELVVDRWDTCCDEVSFNVELTQNEFYDIVIEYKEL